MRPADLLQFYVRDPRNGSLRGALANQGTKVEMHGAVGSAVPLSAAGFLSHEDEQSNPRHHVFVLDDKEQAAYFMNDLQAVLEDSRPVLFYPRSARVPYAEAETVENANIAMRAEVLNEINGGRDGLCIVTFPEALAEQVITRKELSDQTFTISLGESYTMDFLDEVLLAYEFEKVDFVYEPGQYSMRGGIVDIFSFSFDHPYRIEFFGDEVDSIRKFDPTSQLSVAKMTRATVVPNVGNSRLHEAHEPFFSFLPPNSVLWMADAKRCEAGLDKAMERARSHFDRLSGEVKRTPPEELFLDGEHLEGLLEPFSVVEFGGGTTWANRMILKYGMSAQPAFNKQFDLIASNLRSNHKNGYVNVVVSGQATQLERLHDVFHDRLEEGEEPVPYKPIPMELSEGFVDKELKMLVYTDHQLFERYHRFRLKEGFRKNKEALTIKELMSLEVGDFVV
ncbi:MAG: transcription-repair coupling factor, partial [Flavobacteriales bacterium]